MPKKIISNFHGTMFRDVHAGSSWKYVGWEAFTDALKRPWKWPMAAELGLAAKNLYPLIASHERGEIGYDVIYKFFNDHVLYKIPIHAVRRYLMEYSALKKTQDKVDRRVMTPLVRAHNEGAQCSILSTGCDYTIMHTIPWQTGRAPLFDEIVANPVIGHGKGSRFDLAIYTDEERRQALRRMMPPKDTELFYIGNGADEKLCMEEVTDVGGTVVVSLLAPDTFREFAARQYGARTPSEKEFPRALE